jgi:hypothetical protein
MSIIKLCDKICTAIYLLVIYGNHAKEQKILFHCTNIKMGGGVPFLYMKVSHVFGMWNLLVEKKKCHVDIVYI